MCARRVRWPYEDLWLFYKRSAIEETDDGEISRSDRRKCRKSVYKTFRYLNYMRVHGIDGWMEVNRGCLPFNWVYVFFIG